MASFVTHDLPETGSFEIVRTQPLNTAPSITDPVSVPSGFDCPPVYVDGSWHGRHGISRFSAEVLRRLRVPRRYVDQGTKPASTADVVAAWRRGLKRSDVVYTPGFNAGLTRARQVVTLHDLIHLQDRDEASRAKRVYYERLVRPAIRRAGVVLTVSETSKAAIREWIRDDDVVIENVGNGCSELFFRPIHATRDLSQILYVGNLKPHKNPRPIFEALASMPQMRLTLVTGDVEEAQSLATTFHVLDRVRVVGSCTDRELKALYASSGVLALPSVREGFGLAAVESLAVGTPVVHWAGCASVAEVVGPHGIAVDELSRADGWRSAIESALNRADLRARPAGWQARWSWSGVADRIDLALHRVAAS